MKLKNLRNQRFGSLVVCDKPHALQMRGGHMRTFWQCVCDCGNVKMVSAKCLLKGETGSCGCLQGRPGKKKPPRNKDKFNYGNPALACFYSAYKHKAKRRGIEFALTPAQFVELVDSSCFYCGDRYEYSFQWSKSDRDKKYTLIGCGLDRMSPDEGYTLDNVVPACKNCNFAKLELSQKDFFAMVEKIYNRHCVIQEGG